MQLRNRSDYFPKLTLWTFYSYLLRGYQSLESKAADIEEFHWSRGKREIIIKTVMVPMSFRKQSRGHISDAKIRQRCHRTFPNNPWDMHKENAIKL